MSAIRTISKSPWVRNACHILVGTQLRAEIKMKPTRLVPAYSFAAANLSSLVPSRQEKEIDHSRSYAIMNTELGSGAAPVSADVPEGEEWVDRNKLAMAKFYDKSTRIFASICRLSRAYQTSVIEGSNRIFGDEELMAKWKNQEINVLDAGTGSAYFLEKVRELDTTS